MSDKRLKRHQSLQKTHRFGVESLTGFEFRLDTPPCARMHARHG